MKNREFRLARQGANCQAPPCPTLGSGAVSNFANSSFIRWFLLGGLWLGGMGVGLNVRGESLTLRSCLFADPTVVLLLLFNTSTLFSPQRSPALVVSPRTSTGPAVASRAIRRYFDQEKSYHAWTLQCCSLNVKEIRDPTIITRSDHYIFQPRFNHAVSSWPRA